MAFRDDEREDDDFLTKPDEETDTVPCPHCGALVFDEAEQCPECGTYVTEEGAEPQRKPWWIVAGTVACLVVVYFWIRYGA